MLFPEGQRFSCSRCGRCCRTDWDVQVDRPALLRPELLRRTPQGGLLARREAGACVFLTPSGCGIHAEHGVEPKPATCRLFPFILQPTPDGLVVGVSFLCPAIQANEGVPVEEHAAELRELLPRLDLAPVGDGPVEVGAGATLGWAGYRILEEELLARLQTGCPIGVLERAAAGLAAWVREYPASAREALDRYLGDPPPGDGGAGDGSDRGDGSAREALLRRYLRNLVHRKYLVLRGPLLARLERLAREARRLRDSAGPLEEDLAALELELTHGAG